MPKILQQSCYYCRFWLGEGARERGPYGECRRFPPQPSPRFPDGRFPRLLSTQWCGEWQAHLVDKRTEEGEGSEQSWRPISPPAPPPSAAPPPKSAKTSSPPIEQAIGAFQRRFPKASYEEARTAVEQLWRRQSSPGTTFDEE
jgi:hypothetical protein